MSTEKTLLTFLKEKDWWWNQESIRTHGVPGVGWDKEAKQAAHHYELMRRSPKGKQHYGRTYLELNSEEKTFVHVLWCNWPESPWRFATQDKDFDEIGWTRVLPNPPVQWNLSLPNDVLIKAFMREIEMQRVIQQICPRYHRNAAKKKEPYWREIEILDREDEGEKLLDAERSAASKARRKAAEFCGQCRHALADWAHSVRHGHNLPGQERELVLDLQKGVNQALARRERLIEQFAGNASVLELLERFPGLTNDPEGGHFFTYLEFFNFKIVYSNRF
jgi:hypothetical protein